MQVDINGSLPTGDDSYRVIRDFTSLAPLTYENSSGLNLEEQLTHYDLPEKIVIGTLLGIIIFCSITGNSLVCVAILTQRNLRKTSNFFYISLACADALVAAMVMTFAVANDIQGYWVFGRTYCNIWLSSDVMCSTSSILNICAISLDRYLHIRNPYHYSNIMTTKKTLLCIAALWLLSALISFLPIHLGWHKIDGHEPYVGDKFICLLKLNPLYAIISSIVSFYVPCIIMIGIYIKLYLFAKKHVQTIKETSTPGGEPNGGGHAYKPSDHKAAVTLGVIMGTFLFCWVPFFTVNIISALCAECVPSIVFSITTWLGYLNSMANPIIYPIFNKEFRIAFKRVLFIQRCCDSCNGSRNNNKSFRSSNGKTSNAYGTLPLVSKTPNSSSPLIGGRDRVTQL